MTTLTRIGLLLLGAVIGIAGAILSAATVSACDSPARVPVAAAFTGEFERGAPVYRLPSLTIFAKRSVAIEAAAPKQRTPEPRSMRARDARSPS